MAPQKNIFVNTQPTHPVFAFILTKNGFGTSHADPSPRGLMDRYGQMFGRLDTLPKSTKLAGGFKCF